MLQFKEQPEIREFEMSHEEVREKVLTLDVICSKRTDNLMGRYIEKGHSRELWSAYYAKEYPAVVVELVTKPYTKNGRFTSINLEKLVPPLCCFALQNTDLKEEPCMEDPPDPKSLSRKSVVEYIKEYGELDYLKKNNLDKNVNYIMKHNKIQELYKHYNYIKDENSMYA